MEKNSICNVNPARLVSSVILFAAASASHAVVINEIDYDQPGSDNREFIELFNPGLNPVSLDGYKLELINGTSGSAYQQIDLNGLTIAPESYLVLCDNALAVVNCSIGVSSSSWLQNGGSNGDAVVLSSTGTVVDSVAYEGIGSFLGSYAEGNSFAAADSNSVDMSIARLPDGFDSNHNASDFDTACLTPGSANISGTGDCSASISPVPLPAAVWLFGSGLLGLVGLSRRTIRS